MKDLPGSSLHTIAHPKLLKICLMIQTCFKGKPLLVSAPESAEWFPFQRIFFLDKAKALTIRIVSQTAWQIIRSDFIDNEEKMIAKDYTIGVISCDDCTIHVNLTYSQLPKVRSTCILFLSRKRSPHFSTFEVGRFG